MLPCIVLKRDPLSYVSSSFLSSLVNELALTARKMYADEAKESGLVRYENNVCVRVFVVYVC